MNRKERRAAAKSKDHRAICTLANLQEKEGKIADAVASYRQALEIDPSLYKVHNELARLLRQQGLLEEAVVHYERALALAPDEEIICNNIGNMALELGDYARAIECLRRAIALQPGFAKAYGNLAIALEATGQADEAIAQFQHALK